MHIRRRRNPEAPGQEQRTRIHRGQSIFEQRRRRRGKILRYALAVVAALVLVAGVVTAVVLPQIWCDANRNLPRQDGECVGVTDGSFVFAPGLAQVENDIKTENQRISEQKSVTVAVLLPMTSTTTLFTQQDIVSNLEGSYIAQFNYNNAAGNTQAPKIRLVLANEGSRELAWQHVTGQLEGMVHGSSPLVAVTGIGVSTPQTGNVENELARAKIPMIGSEYSSDNLNATGVGLTDGVPIPGSISGLVRVIESNEADIQAVGSYLSSHPGSVPDLSRAVLVDDTNPDDPYADTLAKDFKTVAPFAAALRGTDFLTKIYDAEPGTIAVPAEFDHIASELCDPQEPSLVLYTGRSILLPYLITDLKEHCSQRRITVVTGSDATSLPQFSTKSTNVTVLYAAPNDPRALANPNQSQYQMFKADFLNTHHYPQQDLDTGWAVQGDDAMQTAITAIESTLSSLPNSPLPNAVSVIGTLDRLKTPEPSVRGVSGMFSFDSAGDRIGSPPPVLELGPDAPEPTVLQP